MTDTITKATQADQGRGKARRPEASQDQQARRDMVFIPYEGFLGTSASKEQLKKSLAAIQPAQRKPERPDDGSLMLDALLGTSMLEPPIERHAAIMSDPRFSHPANASTRSRITNRLHQTYGNGHVQRVVNVVQAMQDGGLPGEEVPADVEQTIARKRAAGKPLERGTRSQMESLFGRDLSDVSIHTDSAADSLAKALQAKAFAGGADVGFRGGTHQPGSEFGSNLPSHELTRWSGLEQMLRVEKPELSLPKPSAQRYAGKPRAIGHGEAKSNLEADEKALRGAQGTGNEIAGATAVRFVASPDSVMAKGERAFSKADLKLVLRDIVGQEWTNQSNCRSPIRLTRQLVAIIQMVTPLGEEDLRLLWRKPPKTPSGVLKNIDHSLPARVPKSLMEKVQQLKTTYVMGGKVVHQGEKKSVSVPRGQGPEARAGSKGDEQLIGAIIRSLEGKEPEDKDRTTEALKKVVEAYLETPAGKKYKERALELALSKKGLPLTLIAGGGVLAAMIANNTDIPSTPEIPLSDKLTLKVEFEGTFQKPKSVKFVLKLSFGGPTKPEGKKKGPAVMALPATLEGLISKMDRKNTLGKWIVRRAYHEYEVAGPDDEEHKKKLYYSLRDNPGQLPNVQAIGRALARELIEQGMRNRVNQLRGREPNSNIYFDLGHGELWNEFYDLKGLASGLTRLVRLLVPEVPFRALGIEQVTFVCGSKVIPVAVKR